MGQIILNNISEEKLDDIKKIEELTGQDISVMANKLLDGYIHQFYSEDGTINFRKAVHLPSIHEVEYAKAEGREVPKGSPCTVLRSRIMIGNPYYDIYDGERFISVPKENILLD